MAPGKDLGYGWTQCADLPSVCRCLSFLAPKAAWFCIPNEKTKKPAGRNDLPVFRIIWACLDPVPVSRIPPANRHCNILLHPIATRKRLASLSHIAHIPTRQPIHPPSVYCHETGLSTWMREVGSYHPHGESNQSIFSGKINQAAVSRIRQPLLFLYCNFS